MNLFLVFALLLACRWSFAAEETQIKSRVLPVVLEAIDNILLKREANNVAVEKAQSILLESGVDLEYLKKVKNKFDRLKSNKNFNSVITNIDFNTDDDVDTVTNEGEDPLEGNDDIMSFASPPIAIHAYKIDIINPEDDIFGDNLYCYFFVTDGVIPSGRVTSIYKSSGSGDSIFLDNEDRIVYPLVRTSSAAYRHGRIINKQLIIDLGIVESDGDEIENLQKISSSIVGLATAVYAITHRGTTRAMAMLHREIKNLSDALIKLDHDDRLITDTIILPAEKISSYFTDGSNIAEFVKSYKGKHNNSKWEYLLHFRMLKY